MRAHLGTMVAGFPNLFLLLGPNTGLGHSSVVRMIESQLRQVIAALRHLRLRRFHPGDYTCTSGSRALRSPRMTT